MRLGLRNQYKFGDDTLDVSGFSNTIHYIPASEKVIAMHLTLAGSRLGHGGLS